METRDHSQDELGHFEARLAQADWDGSSADRADEAVGRDIGWYHTVWHLGFCHVGTVRSGSGVGELEIGIKCTGNR